MQMQYPSRWLSLLATLWLILPAARAADTNLNYAPGTLSRVCEVTAPGAIVAYQPDPAVVQQMVTRGVMGLTHQSSEPAAWLSLVNTQDVVGLKVYSQAGLLSGTRPAVVAAVVQGLLAAGLPPQNIIIWDKHVADLRAADYYKLGEQFGIQVVGCDATGYDPKTFYAPDTAVIGNLVWGDLEFGQKGPGIGRKSYVAKVVSQRITKIISIAPLLNLSACGVSGHLFSLTQGSVDNTLRFEDEPDRLAVAVPEIYALPVLGDRVVLNITDALIAQYEGGSRTMLQYSTVLDQLWFSHDPVALDTLSVKELLGERQRHFDEEDPPHVDLYNNAVLLQLGVSDPAKMIIEKIKL